MVHKSKSSANVDRKTDEKNTHQRDKQTIKRLQMQRTRKPDTKAMYKRSVKPAVIEPNRKWFGNTRLMNQDEMDKYKDILQDIKADPYRVNVKSKLLPYELLTQNHMSTKQMDLLSIQPFEQTFGKKATRKKPKLLTYDMEAMTNSVDERNTKYNRKEDQMNIEFIPKEKQSVDEKQITAGQSKRIWEELQKVLDSSDVVMQILDARDPEGTRSIKVEQQLAKNCPHKHIVNVLNKIDLVPSKVVTKWVAQLSQKSPTVAFQASMNRPQGKQALMNVLKQYANVFHGKKSISVGLVGQPNVGKSSVINTLRAKKVCMSAPVPGETKIWQYVTLTKQINLIDCPGVVHESVDKDHIELVLCGIVRVEKLSDPVQQIDGMLARVEPKVIANHYDIDYDPKLLGQEENEAQETNENTNEMDDKLVVQVLTAKARIEQWDKWAEKYRAGRDLDQCTGECVCDAVGRKQGRLLKGDVACLKSSAKIMLTDFFRGNLQWYTPCLGEIKERDIGKNEDEDK